MANVTTISEYLKSVSQLITEDGLRYVLAKRRLTGNEVYSEMSDRDADLAEGTAYYWLSNLPVGGSTEKVSDGGWSHSEGGWQVSKANIEEWLKKYRTLFTKWNEPLLDRSKIRIINF